MSRERYLAELYMSMSGSNIPDEFASPLSRSLAMGREKNETDKIRAFLDNDLVAATKIYNEHNQIEELIKIVKWVVKSGIDMPIKPEGTYSCRVFEKLIKLAKNIAYKRSIQCVLKEILAMIGHQSYKVSKAYCTLNSCEKVLFMSLLSKAFVLQPSDENSFIALIVGKPLCIIVKADYYDQYDMIEIRIVDDREDGLDLMSQQKGWFIKNKGPVSLYAATRVRAAIDNGV